jgi:homocysteine S-methyltransferase
MQPFLQRINQSPVMFDGAMGTMLYSRGVFINTCYDELNLMKPDMVAGIHTSYIEAGADVIETNTFGANRVKLRSHGLADKVEEINRAAVALARKAAGDEAYVAAAVGPCMRPRQMWMDGLAGDLGEAFREQIAALMDGGADLVYLETFDHLDELLLAAEVASSMAVPVFASFNVSPRGETIVGREIEAMVDALEKSDNVDGIGINCGVGPALAYDMVQRALPLTTKPFVVMPNAGMPQEVDGRLIYLTSPEYFTSYAKKFIELGVRGVGGCCGTTPAHIAEAAKAVKSLSGVKKHVEIKHYAPEEVAGDVIPPASKSRFAARILAGEKVTSVELLPPKTIDLTKTIEKVAICKEHNVDAINIPDGPRASARVSPMVTAEMILNKVGIESRVAGFQASAPFGKVDIALKVLGLA